MAKATKIITGILNSCSARFRDIARAMPGGEAGNYISLQRFPKAVQSKEVLLRLFQENAEFEIDDPTEMQRPQAKNTAYLGKLSDGQTIEYRLLF